jgi:hypothetical protein
MGCKQTEEVGLVTRFKDIIMYGIFSLINTGFSIRMIYFLEKLPPANKKTSNVQSVSQI